MSSAATSKYLEWIALAAILLLAAYLRMGQPGIVEYKRDEANLSLLALDFANGGELPLLGIGSSVAIPNAPVNVYILTVPYLFTSSPQVATQYIGLLNVLAFAATYLLARRYIGPIPALIVILLYAVSPWAAIFSRKIWAQNMLPLFVVLTIYSGLRGLADGQRWAQMLFLPLLVITGQIHYGAFVIIPAALYLLWHGRNNITRYFWIGAGVAVLLCVPFALGIALAGLDSFQAASNPDNAEALNLSLQAVRGADILLSGVEIDSLSGPLLVPSLPTLLRMVSVGVLLSAVWLLLRYRRPVDPVLLLWLVFPVVAFSLTWTPFFIHYLIPVFPAAFLVLGIGLDDLLAYLRRQQRPSIVMAVGGLVAGIALLQVVQFSALLDTVNRYPGGGFGIPLGYLMETRESVLESDTEQVLAEVGGDALIFDEGPTVWYTLLYDVPVVRFQDEYTEVYPAEPTLFLSDRCEARVFTVPSGECLYSLERRDDFDPAAFEPIPGLTHFDNGVTLLGYQWQDDQFLLAWQISRPTRESYFFAVNFFDSAGQRLQQADGPAWQGAYWRAGDIVVKYIPLIEADSVSIGMYTVQDGQFFNANLLDEAGNPAGQSAQWDLEP